MTGFLQSPPTLGNQFHDDVLLQAALARMLPEPVLSMVTPTLGELGRLAGDDYYQQSLRERTLEPVHTPWDAWGNRIDHIELTPLWKNAARLAAQAGLVAAGHESDLGVDARVHQFAMIYVMAPSLDLYACPLAMTDGAATTLRAYAGTPAVDGALAHLLSREPELAWTSGQWMTEKTGGSDVSGTETVARSVDDGTWRLHGVKWFTSATTSEISLALARPEGNPPGSQGLALFLVHTRDDQGRLRGITINRLKDKLGTRKVPTAELTLDGAHGVMLGEPVGGVRAVTPMLTITRTWNAVCAAGLARRALRLAIDYARRREAFGSLLIDKPLHVDTLAGLVAEVDGMTLLSLRAAELLGAAEHGDDAAAALLRVMTPLLKLSTGKQAVAVTSEAIEACGGAGYIEDTGLPRILADAQVLPIWEGTTNVLSLDSLRALAKPAAVAALQAELESRLDGNDSAPATVARNAMAAVVAWLQSGTASEAEARRVAMTAARALQLGELCHHAAWCRGAGHDDAARAAAAAARFAWNGIDLLAAGAAPESARLLLG